MEKNSTRHLQNDDILKQNVRNAVLLRKSYQYRFADDVKHLNRIGVYIFGARDIHYITFARHAKHKTKLTRKILLPLIKTQCFALFQPNTHSIFHTF